MGGWAWVSECEFSLAPSLFLEYYEDLKHSKEELEKSLKHYRRGTAALKDENERLKVSIYTNTSLTLLSCLSLPFFLRLSYKS